MSKPSRRVRRKPKATMSPPPVPTQSVPGSLFIGVRKALIDGSFARAVAQGNREGSFSGKPRVDFFASAAKPKA